MWTLVISYHISRSRPFRYGVLFICNKHTRISSEHNADNNQIAISHFKIDKNAELK